MSTKRALKVIEGFGPVALPVLLVPPLYVAQELLAALILFSIGCVVIALLGLALFLIDAIGRALFRKLEDAARACATFAHHHWSFTRDSGESRPLFFVGPK
jgi:hypothetical protein